MLEFRPERGCAMHREPVTRQFRCRRCGDGEQRTQKRESGPFHGLLKADSNCPRRKLL
jgi:hypothetical protein